MANAKKGVSIMESEGESCLHRGIPIETFKLSQNLGTD